VKKESGGVVVTMGGQVEGKRQRGYDSNGSPEESDSEDGDMRVGDHFGGGNGQGEMLNVAQTHDPNLSMAATDLDAFPSDERAHKMKQHLACQQVSSATYNRNTHITDILERMEQL
jgi:hypothetical protein